MLPYRRIAIATLLLCVPGVFAQTPTFSVVDTTALESTFGNAGKDVLAPQVSGFSGVAFGNGLFVAPGAGVGETVFRWATSSDGTTWTGRSQPMPSGTTIGGASKVHYINGKFIVFVGQSNTGFGETHCYTSTDGLSWTDNGKLSGSVVNVVEFDGSPNLYVAAATNGAQFTSPDLVTWTSHPVINGGGVYSHNDVAQLNGKFVSTINGGAGTGYSSSDGVTWTQIPALNGVGGPFVEAGNGFFIGTYGGGQFKSTDGVTFTKLTPTAPANWLPPGGSPRYTSAGFVATGLSLEPANLGKTGYMVSADGVKWTPVAFIPDNAKPTSGFISRAYAFADIAYGNGKYVMAGTDTQQAAFSIVRLPAIATVAADALPAPPSITTAPVAANGVLGGTATFSVTVGGAGDTYQWKKDTVAISGATSATLTLSNLTAASAGNYSVVVTNSVGSVTTTPVALTLVTASNAGRLVNMSIRTNAGTGDNVLIVGVGLGGANTSGTKALLVRGVGPTLTAFGVTGALADPVVTAYQGSTAIAQNDDWAGGFDFNAVGAFALAGTTPKDAAIYNAATPIGSYSIQIAGKNNGTGIALAEIYDATPSSSVSAATPRLVNVSARTQVGTGDNILITGFVIGGSTPVRVLIRAAGPSLGAFGVSGALTNPKLEVYGANGAKVAENDNWQGTAELKAAATSVGAFGFASDASQDAALVATLPAGSYTAQVSGVGGTTGVALVELYELP